MKLLRDDVSGQSPARQDTDRIVGKRNRWLQCGKEMRRRSIGFGSLYCAADLPTGLAMGAVKPWKLLHTAAPLCVGGAVATEARQEQECLKRRSVSEEKQIPKLRENVRQLC